MKSVFKTHFLKKLNKEDIKLLKTYGLTSAHGRKASGVEFFEKVHEIVEKEYNAKVIPLTVVRKLPTGERQIIGVD